MIAPILARRNAAGFWLAVVLTGAGTGLAAIALTALLEWVQHVMWGGHGLDLLQAAARTPPLHHLAILIGAGVLTGAGQLLLTRLPSGNGIDITAAIWFQAGHLPALRTLGSAMLSVTIVGMGAALGREGAPKQAGAVIANAMSDRVRLSDEERRLVVACGAGAGMAAAYGVPLGGALFALEVLRGALALRFVLPAMVTTLVATGVSWAFLPDTPTYVIPAFHGSLSSTAWALLAGPVVGLVSVAYVRSVAWADGHKPTGWRRVVAPVVVFGVLGAVSIPFPQLLGNGRDVAAMAFTGQIGPELLVCLVLLRPAATVLCLGSGAPGGLFTPSLALGALLGGALGIPWAWLWPGVPPGLFALVGAAGMLATTTQGPISTVVLMMELTGYARAAIVPMLVVVATATLIARTIEPRSIYDARLTDEQVRERQRARDHAPGEPDAGADAA
ncbi:chloride channel protein [Acidisphaera sp. S103]|uniref:chloride channel protein n=1 Tax=Acidisphaera sp. S103 TaxID=1747223 RepID=UPI00131BC06E|nr:chloride channel protein [Acidisphaera sp. S103]